MGSILTLQTIGATEATMSSREIAEVVESRHDSVKRTIERLVKSRTISQPPLVDGDKAGNHVVEQVYLVGKRDSYVIVAQMSPAFTGRLVDRWQELEQQVAMALPDFTNPAEAARAWADQVEARQALEVRVTADAPKVAFAEAVRAIDGACHIEKIAKTLKIGRNKLFRRLRSDGILLDNNLPYQKYIDREYFTVIEQQPYKDSKGVTHATFTTMVTGAGQVFLAKRYANIVEGANA
jgi:phage antirepressor YoqD-like protein